MAPSVGRRLRFAENKALTIKPDMAFAFRAASFSTVDLHILDALESGLLVDYTVSLLVEIAPQRRALALIGYGQNPFS